MNMCYGFWLVKWVSCSEHVYGDYDDDEKKNKLFGIEEKVGKEGRRTNKIGRRERPLIENGSMEEREN